MAYCLNKKLIGVLRKGVTAEEAKRAKAGSYQLMAVPCGKCLACRMNRKREWIARLRLELQNFGYNASFVTLTYDESNNPFELSKRDLQLFFKRLRKQLPKSLRIKYFACGEYGDLNFRPHYHAIIFGLDPDVDYGIDLAWSKGQIDIGSVTMQSIAYVCGYVQKKLGVDSAPHPDFQQPFNLTSQGIGRAWCDQYADILKERKELTIKGERFSVPRYFVRRLGLDMPKDDLMEKEARDRIISKGLIPAEEVDGYLAYRQGFIGKDEFDFILAKQGISYAKLSSIIDECNSRAVGSNEGLQSRAVANDSRFKSGF